MTHGYFWLAWTWDNLLFACGACNLRKSTRFPLTLGCEPLQPEEAPPGREHPLLIDPADHSRDPFEHICFRLVEEGGRMRWKPFPRNGSIHGATTIRVLGLDGQGLLEHYNRHVTLMVEPAVRDIDEAVARARATGDLTRLQQRWQARLDWLLDPEQPLIGLSCDALAHFYSRMFRRRWRLDSPRPVHPGPSTSL